MISVQAYELFSGADLLARGRYKDPGEPARPTAGARQRSNPVAAARPLAPRASVIARMRDAAAAVFTSLGLDEHVISQEIAEMNAHQLAKTTSRNILGRLNDFASSTRLA